MSAHDPKTRHLTRAELAKALRGLDNPAPDADPKTTVWQRASAQTARSTEPVTQLEVAVNSKVGSALGKTEVDTEHLRVGNPEYAKENKSFGATTLLGRHLRQTGRKLKMRFAGKHGIVREVTITDRRLARVVRKCVELPGQALFQYVNGDGQPQPITSSDVNDYIREACGGDFTAKNFRTWAASVIAFDQMLTAAEEERAKISLKTVLEPVAEALGNTPAISRKSYVHPKLIEAARDRPRNPLNGMERPRARKWLSSAEVGLLDFLAGKNRRSAKPATSAAEVPNAAESEAATA